MSKLSVCRVHCRSEVVVH